VKTINSNEIINLFALKPSTKKRKKKKETEIAVATVSGRAYYLLVNELKKRGEPFLSLTPSEEIPVGIKVVLTTKKERSEVNSENTIDFVEDGDPTEVVEEAIRLVKGKESFENLVIGIDPGLNFGVAVLGDKNLIESKNCVSVGETIKMIDGVLKRTPAANRVVRIGDGAPAITNELLSRFSSLPDDVVLEVVSEEGTSKSLRSVPHRRGEIDVNAAIKIAQRQGRPVSKERKSRGLT
jgi:hypothetical protein